MKNLGPIDENEDVVNKKYVDDNMKHAESLPVGSEIYFDGDVEDIPTGWVQTTDYSTTEKEIGTWIDGRPLYRKTIVLENVTIPSNSNEIVIMDITNNDVIMVENYYLNMDTSSSAGNRHKILQNMYDTNNKYVAVRGWQNNLLLQSNIFYYVYKGYITVKYTKTTD